LCYPAGSEGHRIPVVRPDFKSGEIRVTGLVGSTPISFRPHPGAYCPGREIPSLSALMSTGHGLAKSGMSASSIPVRCSSLPNAGNLAGNGQFPLASISSSMREAVPSRRWRHA